MVGPGHTVRADGAYVGQEIVYSYDEMGLVLGGFTPVDEWMGPEVPGGVEGVIEGLEVEVVDGEIVTVEEGGEDDS